MIHKDFLEKNITNVESELTRGLIYRCWFDMVRDARVMRSTDLIETLVRSIPKEPSAYNVNNMFLYLGGCLENFCPANKYDEYLTSALINHP